MKMLRYGKILLCVAPLFVVAACEDDSGVTDLGPPPPAALIRFVNAVPDTGTVDFRFVDKVENLPTLQGVGFRGASGMFQRAEPGARAARIFPSSTVAGNMALTSIFLVDTTLTLAAETRYTFVYAGRASGNQDRVAVFEEPPAPTPPTAQIAVKALHAAVGTGNVDVYIVSVASLTAATPADFQAVNAGVIRNVSYLSNTAYANVPVVAGTGFYRFVVTAAGSSTPLFAATPNLPGATQPAGASYGPQPGVRISGSVLTAVIAPGSIAGTRESTTANQTPTVVLLIDKVLNP
ncbi:MAG: DUF4397 domain-containing protein [Gemmatimonadota bacterium]